MGQLVVEPIWLYGTDSWAGGAWQGGKSWYRYTTNTPTITGWWFHFHPDLVGEMIPNLTSYNMFQTGWGNNHQLIKKANSDFTNGRPLFFFFLHFCFLHEERGLRGSFSGLIDCFSNGHVPEYWKLLVVGKMTCLFQLPFPA